MEPKDPIIEKSVDAGEGQSANIPLPRKMQMIKEDALGVSTGGEVRDPLSVEALLRKYSKRELQFGIKAAILEGAMQEVALATNLHTFQKGDAESGYIVGGPVPISTPGDLLYDTDNADYTLLHGYVATRIAKQTDEYYARSFAPAHPTANEALRLVNPQSFERGESVAKGAAYVGTKIIVSFHQFLRQSLPLAEIPQALVNSLPLLYKLAFAPLPMMNATLLPVLFDRDEPFLLNSKYFQVEGLEDPARASVGLVTRAEREGMLQRQASLYDPEINRHLQMLEMTAPMPTAIGCAAVYAPVPMSEALREVCGTLNFHPKQLNGITFPMLLALLAIHQGQHPELLEKKS